MDKQSDLKGNTLTSPTLLTPCRPVGLRRKRSGVKTPNTPALKVSTFDNGASPLTSLSTGLTKPQILIGNTAPAKNVDKQEIKNNSEEKSPANVASGTKQSNKRKSTTPCRISITRRKILSRNADDSPILHEKGTEKKLSPEGIDKSLCERKDNSCSSRKFEEQGEGGKVSCSIKNQEENTVGTRPISANEIKILKERIVAKEKKLKELKLAELYKKKHDCKQVAKEIETWLQGSKDALNDLQSELSKRGQSYSLSTLLKNLGIPSSLIEIEEDDSE